MKGHSKYKKREGSKTIIKIVYHFQDNDNIDIAGIKKESIDFKKGNRNGI